MNDSAPGPLYQQVFRILAGRIRSGAYGVGQQLPVETALMREFGVSRATIRAAVGHLEADGMVERTAGRGTFVAGQRRLGFDWSIEAIEDLVDRAPDLRYEVLACDMIAAGQDALAAERLALRPGERMLRVAGRRLLAGKPYAYTVVRFPEDIGASLPIAEFATESFTVLIERHCGLVAAEVRQAVMAGPADKPTAKATRLAVGAPVLLFERTFLDERGRALQFATLAYRPDRYQQHTRLFRRRPAGQMRRRLNAV